MHWRVMILVGALALWGWGCGDDDSPGDTDAGGDVDAGGGGTDGGDGDAGPGAGDDAGGGGSDAGSGSRGDCASDDDCPGGTCIELSPGGFRVCSTPPEVPSACPMPAIDECCEPADCMAGTCVLGPAVPFCGGPAVVPHNVCAVDQCETDDDCGGGGVCVPAGTLGRMIAACVSATCLTDADCTEDAGGRCVTVADPCCGVQSLACVYPTDGCRSNADCPMGFCGIDGDRSQCMAGAPKCPL